MKRKISILASFCALAFLAGCAQQPGSEAPAAATPAPAATPATAPAASAPAASATPAPAGGNVIYINSQMRYAQSLIVDTAVLTECQLPQQGAELLEAAARGAGFTLVRNDDGVKSGKGRSFQVEIISVVSAGNAFIGHRKQVGVRGRLMEDGKELAIFQASRTSMGGAFAGFKGSCSVLGRCLETLSKDMTDWLRLNSR